MCRTALAAFALLSSFFVSGCAVPREHRFDPLAKGPYSASVRYGDLVFLAGKVGRERDSFAQEVQSAIDGVEDELVHHGLDLSDVLSVNVFVTDVARYAEVNAIYAERFFTPYPARTFVGVAALPGGAAIELQVVAAAGRSR